MKIRIFNTLAILIIIFSTMHSNAQMPKHDYQWILGGKEQGSLLNFNSDSVEISYVQKDLYMRSSNVSMCDSVGNLLFYSNGCSVYNQNHVLMENGDGINPDVIQDFYCHISSGSPIPAAIALPAPEQPDIYYLIHHDLATVHFGTPLSTIAPVNLFYTKIDMSLGNGLGAVIEKNKVILQDTFSRSYLQAIPHANGRDWWVISPEFLTNCYYLFLLSPNGFKLERKQCIGEEWNQYDLGGQAVFTPNGEKYIRSNLNNGLDIFDFDRCTGNLYNYTRVQFDNVINDISGMAVSPNSQYVYISAWKKLFQYDLQAPNIDSSKILIAEWDGFSNPNPTTFYLAQLAPNNKIYIVGFQTDYNLHVINNPDSAGIACDFVQHEITLPSNNSLSIPRFPNFRTPPPPSAYGSFGLSVSVNVGEVNCYGDSSEVSFVATCGTPPYEYIWSDTLFNGMSSATLPPNTFYNITLTDALDSTGTFSFETPFEPTELTLSLQTQPEIGNAQNGSANAIAIGGTFNYIFTWKKDSVTIQENFGIDDEIFNLSAGEYELIITDANGCTTSEIFIIEQTSSFEQTEEQGVSFRLFPNPSSSQTRVLINVNNPTDVTIDLFSANGQLIQNICKKCLVQNEFQYEIPDLPFGVYFVSLKTETTSQMKRLIVMN